MRHPLIGLALAILLVCPAALSWLATAWQLHAIKETVEERLRAGLPEEELVVLAFAKSEASQLEWEHDSEFEYQGQMYDLASTEIRHDSLFYTCYPDYAETVLGQRLHRCLADWLRHNPTQQEQGERLHCFFRSLYCHALPNYDSSALTNTKPTFSYLPLHSRGLQPPPLPPPDPLA